MMSFPKALAYPALRPLVLSVALALALCTSPLERAAGQPANGDIIGQLAADCATMGLAAVDTLELIPDDRYEFIRTAVVLAMQNQGTVVMMSQAPATSTVNSVDGEQRPSLRYRIENGEVRYSKAGGVLAREIVVDTRVLATMSDNSVARDTLCTKSFSDQIRPADVDDVEDPNQPLTLGNRPDKGWLRRIAEPAVVAAASAVAVYLFFNVRSDRNETP
ncbi:MAG: hypothetical protein KJO98_11665 [Rhodothermia bacterium]|nr:hypothetical protein [Rhodothermia bacterium]